MTKKIIVAKTLSPPVGPFSQGVRDGDFIFVSGQVAQDPRTGKVVEGGVDRQTEQVLHNLGEVLSAAGKSFSDVVRVGVYLTNMAEFSAMNAVYAKHFKEPYPARTTIAVAALPLGAAVEMDLVVKD